MSKIIDLQEKKEKIEKKKIILYMILSIITIYIIVVIHLIIKTPTDTVTVNQGVLTSEESITGYIIRDEKVVKGKKYKNGIYPILKEGERAAKEQAIFRYYGDNEKKIEEDIQEINLKIQTALEKEDTVFSSDIKNLDEQIEKKLKDIQKITDVQKIDEIKNEINKIIVKKSTIAGELSPKGSYIKKLINQREEYEKELANGSETINAPMSGVVSYRVDGLENILTTDDFSNLTEEDLEGLDLKTGKIISSSNESAKVIDNFGCYIGTILDSQSARDAEVGDQVKITLSNGEEHISTIESIKQQKSGKILIVFKINTLTEELITYRKISFNITWWSYTGLKVPNNSIAEDENGQKFVLKKTSSEISKILIKVLKTNDKYSIISTYSEEDLNALGIDSSTYEDINMYDIIMMYPNEHN